jgi:hypothetical protein
MENRVVSKIAREVFWLKLQAALSEGPKSFVCMWTKEKYHWGGFKV